MAGALRKQYIEAPLVLAIPRSAVGMGRIVATRLIRAEFNLLLVRKIPSPHNPDYPIGAVNEFGDIRFNDDRFDRLNLSQDEMQMQAERAMMRLSSNERSILPISPFQC